MNTKQRLKPDRQKAIDLSNEICAYIVEHLTNKNVSVDEALQSNNATIALLAALWCKADQLRFSIPLPAKGEQCIRK